MKTCAEKGKGVIVQTWKLLGQCPHGKLLRTAQGEAHRQYKEITFEEAKQVIDDYICFYNY
jgi:hypothetical protein